MPGFVKTPADENKWQHAKDISDAIRRKKGGKKINGRASNKYALANWIFHHRLNKASLDAVIGPVEATKRKLSPYYIVYFVSPKTQKMIVMQAYPDQAGAKEHLAQFKKRYGKLVQAGIQETFPDKNKDLAIQHFSGGRAMKQTVAKCRDLIRQRKEWSR
jgi:hypothetical protein